MEGLLHDCRVSGFSRRSVDLCGSSAVGLVGGRAEGSLERALPSDSDDSISGGTLRGGGDLK